MSHWILLSAGIFALLLVGGGAVGPVASQDPTPVNTADSERYSGRLAKIEKALREEVNRVRALHQRSGLQSHPALTEVARKHSRDMIKRDYFSHLNPEHENALDRLLGPLGKAPAAIAENLWMQTGSLLPEPAHTTARRIVMDWLGSAGHRRNLLLPDFTHVGIAFECSDDGKRSRVTQVLADLRR